MKLHFISIAAPLCFLSKCAAGLFAPASFAPSLGDPSGCNHTQYNVTFHLNSESGKDKAIPIVHRSGRLYAIEGQEATQWTLERAKTNSDKWTIYTTHPSGAKQYWAGVVNDDIQLTTNEYGRQEYTLATAEPMGSPVTRVAIYHDTRCLYNPKVSNDVGAIRMAELSHCENLVVGFEQPLEWRQAQEMCRDKKLQTNRIQSKVGSDGLQTTLTGDNPHSQANECDSYDDCDACALGLSWRCCEEYEEYIQGGIDDVTRTIFRCACQSPFDGIDEWNKKCK